MFKYTIRKNTPKILISEKKFKEVWETISPDETEMPRWIEVYTSENQQILIVNGGIGYA